VRENPSAKVGDNRTRVKGEFGGVDMEEIYACRYQVLGVWVCAWYARLTCREPAVLAVIGDDRARAMDGCMVRFSTCTDGTIAGGQGEDGVVTAVPRVFDRNALGERLRRHLVRGVKVAVSNAAYVGTPCP
jgi:hypothetical protein